MLASQINRLNLISGHYSVKLEQEWCQDGQNYKNDLQNLETIKLLQKEAEHEYFTEYWWVFYSTRSYCKHNVNGCSITEKYREGIPLTVLEQWSIRKCLYDSRIHTCGDHWWFCLLKIERRISWDFMNTLNIMCVWRFWLSITFNREVGIIYFEIPFGISVFSSLPVVNTTSNAS